MDIIPAVDIIGGKVVRLKQGDYNEVTEYLDDPLIVSVKWQKEGAKFLHIVDLDGARLGRPVNTGIVGEIAAKMPEVSIEMGGGIRDIESIQKVLDSGVSRVILGTAIHKDKEFARESISRFGDKVIFGLDTRGDQIALEGWTETANDNIIECLTFFESIGLKRLIYTDIIRDGMLEGPNYSAIEKVLDNCSLEVVAAGGVTTVDDIIALKKYEHKGLVGAIVGKALYENKINLKEAINAG